MQGMNAISGGPLADIAHLRQSIRDILSTPIGSRVMRREYGSRLFELIDAPVNRTTIASIVAATADALDRHEPRIKVQRVTVDALSEGRVSVSITGQYLPDGRVITLDGVEVV